MSIKENVAIPVYNYNENYLCITTNVTTHMLPPATDGNPSVDFLSATEISYVNGISNCFRTGLAQFAEEDRASVFEEILKFYDWKNIIYNDEIENILLNPTIDGLQKIIDITDQSIFDRVRTIYVRIKENNEEDLSNRVIKIIDTRYEEFRKGILKSKIVIKPKDTKTDKTVSADEVNAIKEQNNLLTAQLAEMQKMFAEMQKANAFKADSNPEEEIIAEDKKKGGRPSIKK